MRDYITLSSTPYEEDCAQVGSEDYAARAKDECSRFMTQILRHYPNPAKGMLATKSFPHDFGSYYEVVAYFDDADEESTRWAYSIEADDKGVLSTWEQV